MANQLRRGVAIFCLAKLPLAAAELTASGEFQAKFSWGRAEAGEFKSGGDDEQTSDPLLR